MELFPEEEMQSLSPKVAWMKCHNIKTRLRDDLGDDPCPWEAYKGKLKSAIDDFAEWADGSDRMAWGMNEEDALEALAMKRKIKFYR